MLFNLDLVMNLLSLFLFTTFAHSVEMAGADHSVARQCYTVVRATQQVNGKWQSWGCQNSITPEPID